MRQKKLALSLRGGGAKAMGYLGFLQLLHEKEVDISLLMGSSMGAMVSVGFASNIPVEKMLEHGKTWKLKDMISLNSLWNLSITDSDRLREWGEEVVTTERIEDLGIKTFVQVTDLITGENVITDNGPLAEFVTASCSHPLFARPVNIAGRLYLDGDLSSGYEAQLLRDLGAEVVIGLDTAGLPEVGESELSAIYNSFRIGRKQLLDRDLATNPVDLLIDGFGMEVQPLDFPNSQLAYDAGYSLALEFWPQVEKLIYQKSWWSFGT